MKRLIIGLACFFALFSLVFAVDGIGPYVVSRTPVGGSVDVPINTEISVLFSEQMNKPSVENAISVFPPVAGEETYAWSEGDKKVTVKFGSLLEYSTRYTAIVSKGAKNIHGKSIIMEDRWVFDTEAEKYVLEPDDTMSADSNGFIKLKAKAGYYEGGYLYCYDTFVNATVNGYVYELNKQYNCDFTKYIQLPAGSYEAAFNAVYPDKRNLEANITFDVGATSELKLTVYGISNGTSFKKGSTLPLKAQMSIGNSNVEGTIAVALKKNDGTYVKQVMLSRGKYTYDGEIALDVDVNSYLLHFAGDYGSFHAEKEYRIIVSESENISSSLVGQKKLIVSSPEERTYSSNESVPFIAEFKDENNFIITGAAVSAKIMRSGEEIQNLNLSELKWYYQTVAMLTEAGEYSAVIAAKKGNATVTKTVNFLVGTSYSIAVAANFTVKILTPRSDVYSKNAVIEVRAKVTKAGEPVRDANVVMAFLGREIQMGYDSFGEYVANIGPLNESEYTLEVVANYGSYTAKDETTFLVSGHYLVISEISPYNNQTFDFAKGTPLRINATVLDEIGDKVYGAQVIAQITEPDGTLLEMQLFQDTTTGVYSALLYLDKLDGKYTLRIDATHPQFVSAHSDSFFTITFIKEKITILGYEIGYETLLMIIFGVAVVILLAALFKAF